MAFLSAGITAGAALPLYETQFDAPAFTAGETVDGIEGWEVLNDPAVVAAGDAALGGQYVQLGSGAILDRAVDGSEGVGELWVQAFFRGRGSNQTLAELDAEIDFPASAIVHFSEANGIEVEDGNGEGTAGDVVALGVPLGQANENTWQKLTLQIDFGAKNWNIWVGGEKKSPASGFGFRSDDVDHLSGFRQMAQGSSGFDGFRVVTLLAGDANGDGSIDAADIVAVVEFLAGGDHDPILMANADLTGTGDVGQGDLNTLIGMLIAAAP